MGTNFYRRLNFDESIKKKLHELVDEGKFHSSSFLDNNELSISSLISELTEGTHICKRSAGWYILFDHNWGHHYQPTRAGLERFLAEPGYHIEDENGDTHTFEEFWKMVDDWNNGSKSNGEPLWDSEAYRMWELKNNMHVSALCIEDIREVRNRFGIKCTSNDFMSADGLRFAVFSDFR